MAIINPPINVGSIVHRHGRVSTGAVAANSLVDVVVPFTTPFPDANYTVVATVEEGTAGDTLRIAKIVSKTATSITFRVNNPSLGSVTGILNIIAMHDSVW